MSKPPRSGAASTVGPYFATNQLKHAGVGKTGGDFGAELADHAVGVGAADVVALEQDLAAAADAHELVADGVEARGGCAGAEHGDGENAEECDVEEALTHARLPGFFARPAHLRRR